MAARLYIEQLTRFLDWSDRFFGDAERADRTLFPRAFGSRRPAPLWTAPAFHRCLLLALIYPIVTIYFIWAFSGHVGRAEAALHFQPGLPGWRRGLVVATSAFMLAAMFGGNRSTGLRLLGWMAVSSASVYALGVGGADAGAVCIGGAGAVVVAVAFTFTFTFALAVGVSLASDTAANRGWQGVVLSVFVVMMIMASVTAAKLSPLPGWEVAGPMLLFLGLLTLLNAPFDWVSLGLTRALLRRGLELGEWWPYALALVDAGLAAIIIAALALSMVLGVQAFDTLAAHAGGARVLPLEPLFTGIGAHPNAPEYWWLYALLLSTMIPSLVNLVIGGASLTRGLPGLPSLLLRKIPAQGNVLKWGRHWIATVLTAQLAAGAALGIAAQGLLVVLIIGYVMAFFGLELLDMAREVAAVNLPARAGQLFGG